MNELVECPKCGWVHFAVSEEYVQNWEKEWETYCKEWTDEHLEFHGIKNRVPPTRDLYLECFRCGNKDTKTFFLTKKDLYGHTIQPILWEKS